MILITGATGKVGQALVQDLAARKTEFKVMVRSKEAVRNLEAQGIKAVHGDFDRPGTFADALAGVRQVFLLTVPHPGLPGVEREFLMACKLRNVKHVVRLSAVGANPWAASGLLSCHGRCEQQLQDSGLAWTLLRPTMFMQNLGLYFAPTVARESTLYAPAGQSQIPWVDTRDIAAVAATVLTSAGHENLVYDLTGPMACTYAEVADMIGARVGRHIGYVDVPDGAARQAMIDTGMPAWTAEGMINLYHMFKTNGFTALALDTVERVTGQPARTLDAYIQENLEAFRTAVPVVVRK